MSCELENIGLLKAIKCSRDVSRVKTESGSTFTWLIVRENLVAKYRVASNAGVIALSFHTSTIKDPSLLPCDKQWLDTAVKLAISGLRISDLPYKNRSTTAPR